MELPMQIQKAVSRYEPIKESGLTLWPVLVKEYDLLLIAKPAIDVMQQSLPVALMRIPLLSALYRMDYDAVSFGKEPPGLFSRALLALALSLRLGTGMEPDERVRIFQVAVEREKPENLARLLFTDADGKEKEIRPAQYQRLRQIIAAQNGIKLESDLANPDIVKAQNDMASSNGIRLNASPEDLISAIAALSGADETEIDEWPVLKLERRSTSYRRIIDYIVHGVGELSGASWKNGNPTPHPFFERMNDGGGVLSLIGDTANGAKTVLPEQARVIADQSKTL